MYPVPCECIFRLFVLVPVICSNTIALNQQIANIALLHGMTTFVCDHCIVARNKLACTAWLDLPNAVTDEDMEYFGRTDTIQNWYMESIFPAAQDIAWQ